MTRTQKKLFSAVFWAPVTWVPLTAASAGFCLAHLPWWGNLLSFSAALTFIAAVWGRSLPRLLDLWQLEETQEHKNAEEQARRDLVIQLSKASLSEASSLLDRAYTGWRSMVELVKTYPWLATFDFLKNITALVTELEESGKKLLPEKAGPPPRIWKFEKENFTSCVAAIDDTLSLARETITNAQKEAGLEGASGQAKILAEEIIRKNKITSKVIKNMDDPEKQST